MTQAAQLTSAKNANVTKRLSDLDEDGMRQHEVHNADQAIRSWVKYRSEFPRTSMHAEGVESATMQTLEKGEEYADLFSGVLFLPEPQKDRPTPVTFHALQEWEGYVTEINDADITARLTDLTAGANYASEEASIPLDEISEDDVAKMQVGSIFRWVIGYERAAGSKKRVSNIVFRDLPVITRSDLRDGQEWARKITTAFGQ